MNLDIEQYPGELKYLRQQAVYLRQYAVYLRQQAVKNKSQDTICKTHPDLAKVGEVGVWGHKREWVGLTKEEVDSWELPDCPTVFKFAQFIEAKLKEKNGG